jgi:hypothetical protein
VSLHLPALRQPSRLAEAYRPRAFRETTPEFHQGNPKMTDVSRILALLIAAGALGATAIGTDAFAKPISGNQKPTIVCIKAPCGPAPHYPRVEHQHKPEVVCIRAPCGPAELKNPPKVLVHDPKLDR